MANWSGLRVFDGVQKRQYLVHSCYIAQWLNPRLTWCSKGEDYMDNMQVVLQSCARGSKPHQVNNNALDNIPLVIHVMYTFAGVWCPTKVGYVGTSGCIHIKQFECAYEHIDMDMYICIYIYTCVYIYIYQYVYVCVYIDIYGGI